MPRAATSVRVMRRPPCIVWRLGRASLRSHNPRLVMIRGTIGAASLMTWFYGLSTVPLAEATAISFTSAIFGSIGAVLVLGERMRLRRGTAAVIGFIGVLVILRPVAGVTTAGALLVLLSAVLWGINTVVVKSLARTDSSLSIVVWTGFTLAPHSLASHTGYDIVTGVARSRAAVTRARRSYACPSTPRRRRSTGDPSMLEFFYAPHTCALASHIALEQTGADYEAVRLDFKASQQRTPESLAVNPKGRVPALVTDRGVLTETPAILCCLAQSSPAAKQAPTDPFDLARAQAFNTYLCSTVHVAHAHRLRGTRWADDPGAIEAKIGQLAMENDCLAKFAGRDR